MKFPADLTTEQAATLTGYHRTRIVQLAAASRIKARKHGNGSRAPWIIDRDSILAYKPERTGPKRKSKALETQELRDFPQSAAASQA